MTTIAIPASKHTVDVHIFDTTFRLINGRPQGFMSPAINGFDRMNALAYSFLISHHDSTGNVSKFLFDLGAPKNWDTDLPPSIVEVVRKWERAGIRIEVERYVSDVLVQNGVALEEIEGVIWSHPHWDHIGRPALFPSSTKLIVGPGTTTVLGPGYPENEDSFFRSEAFANREVEELSFVTSSSLSIGGMPAIDFFGDGSFYFLDAPGHAVGHINALARVSTSPDTFIFMGADSYHHPAALRPSEGVPLPKSIEVPGLHPCPCPSELLLAFHPCAGHEDTNQTPFVKIGEKSPAVDLDAARDTLRKIETFDADENVLVLAAHDWSMKDIVEYYPQRANDWKQKAWKTKGRWRFLADFQRAVNIVAGGRL